MEEAKSREEKKEWQNQRHEAILKRDKYRHVATRIITIHFGFIVLYLILQIISSQERPWYMFLSFVLPAITFVIIILFARRRELISGIISIAIGLACLAIVFSAYRADPSGLGSYLAILVFIFGALPPLIAGVLFISSWRIDKKLKETQIPPQ